MEWVRERERESESDRERERIWIWVEIKLAIEAQTRLATLLGSRDLECNWFINFHHLVPFHFLICFATDFGWEPKFDTKVKVTLWRVLNDPASSNRAQLHTFQATSLFVLRWTSSKPPFVSSQAISLAYFFHSISPVPSNSLSKPNLEAAFTRLALRTDRIGDLKSSWDPVLKFAWVRKYRSAEAHR